MTWLIGIAGALGGADGRRARMLAWAGAGLSAAVYAQPTGALTSAVLGAITVAALVVERIRVAEVWPAAIVSSAILAPMLAWLSTHYRSAYPDTFGRWLLHEVNLRHPTEWASSLTNVQMLTVCSGAFWDFFSPSNLIVAPGEPGWAALLLVPTAVLAVIGVARALRATEPRIMRVLVAAFIAGPLVAAMFRDPRAANRALMMVPIAMILAVTGAVHLARSSRKLARITCVALIVAVPLQVVIAYPGLSRGSLPRQR
jgi:hypothetical protein